MRHVTMPGRADLGDRLASACLACCLFLLLVPMARALSAEPLRIVIAMPGPHVSPFLPVELISPLGLDKQAGFKLEIRYFGGGPLAARDLIDRNSDFAGLGMPALAGLHLGSPGLLSIAALTRVPAYTLLARRGLENELRTVKQLRGRTIGVHSGSKSGKSTAQQMTEFLLSHAGVGLDEVNFVAAGQKTEDYSAALLSGQVDAIMTNEPAASVLVARGAAYRLVDLHDPAKTRELFGGLFLYTQLATRLDVIHQAPDKVKRLVMALRRAQNWMQSHTPAEIVESLGIADDGEKQAMRRFLQEHSVIFSPDPSFSDEPLSNSEHFFRTVGGNNPAVAKLRFRDLVDDRWAGRNR